MKKYKFSELKKLHRKKMWGVEKSTTFDCRFKMRNKLEIKKNIRINSKIYLKKKNSFAEKIKDKNLMNIQHLTQLTDYKQDEMD